MNKKLPKVKMYAIEPTEVKRISDYIKEVKAKTGLSIRRIVTEFLLDAIAANRFGL